MTEKGKERLKKLGKIALGLGALGAAGAGTYYAAKKGHLGAAAQNLADHGSTEPVPVPEPTTKEKMQAALAAAGAKGKEYADAAADFAREHKGAVAGAGAAVAGAGAAGLGVHKVNKAINTALTKDPTNTEYLRAMDIKGNKAQALHGLKTSLKDIASGNFRGAKYELSNTGRYTKNALQGIYRLVKPK